MKIELNKEILIDMLNGVEIPFNISQDIRLEDIIDIRGDEKIVWLRDKLKKKSEIELIKIYNLVKDAIKYFNSKEYRYKVKKEIEYEELYKKNNPIEYQNFELLANEISNMIDEEILKQLRDPNYKPKFQPAIYKYELNYKPTIVFTKT